MTAAGFTFMHDSLDFKAEQLKNMVTDPVKKDLSGIGSNRDSL
jgi:hypothetical protein